MLVGYVEGENVGVVDGELLGALDGAVNGASVTTAQKTQRKITKEANIPIKKTRQIIDILVGTLDGTMEG